MMFVLSNSNMKGSNIGAGSVYPSGTTQVTLCISWVCVAQSLISCQMMFVSFNSRMQGITCAAGSVYLSGAADVNLGFGQSYRYIPILDDVRVV